MCSLYIALANSFSNPQLLCWLLKHDVSYFYAPYTSALEFFLSLGPYLPCYIPTYTFPNLVHTIPSLLGIFSHISKRLFSYFQASGKSSHSGKACLLGRAGSFGSEVL